MAAERRQAGRALAFVLFLGEVYHIPGKDVMQTDSEPIAVPKWRLLVNEAEENEMVVRLLRKKQESEIAYAKLDTKIKDIGERLEMLGSKLRSVPTGGDYRDLLGFLEKAGVGISQIDELLKERNRLWDTIYECKAELGKLGISQQF